MKRKNKKTSSSFDDHIKENKSLDWCDLAYKITCLEIELFNLRDYLDKESISIYLRVIKDCEIEKTARLNKQFNYSKHLKNQLENTILSEE